MVKAAMRCAKIKNLGSLTNVERHGRRQDESSKRRADFSKSGNNLAWSSVDDPLAVVDAFKARKKETGAKEYGGACIALHTVCIISPSWIAETGDIHDPKNPRNIQMFQEARAWADATYGEGSCISARMDLDEKGGGVVDLVIVMAGGLRVGRGPLRGYDAGKEIAWITTGFLIIIGYSLQLDDRVISLLTQLF